MKMKSVGIVLLLALAAGFFLFINEDSHASQVEYKISASSETVKRGEEISVSLAITGNVGMTSVDAYVSYDDSVIEFVSADKDVFTGTTGVLKLTDVFNEEEKEVTYHLTFKGLEVGTADLQVEEMYVTKEGEKTTVVEDAKTKITVKENLSESKDTSLKSLEVFPGELSPVFSEDVDTYQMTVDPDTSELVLSAIPSNENSIVQIDGNENFKAGTNKVVITVTSVSGIAKEYTIIVNKQ